MLVWDKGRIGMGREFRKSHELILHCWQHKTQAFSDGVGRADVFRFAPLSMEERQHPAQKPAALIEELLRVSGATILDPFMGSGTTGVACVRLEPIPSDWYDQRHRLEEDIDSYRRNLDDALKRVKQ